jgi:murein DD-endopeptidase MepM/ murein hydrolase activator NlpD
MRRFLLVLVAALAFAAPASAWTWPASGPVLLAYSFDPAHPYAAGQHRGIDVGGAAGEMIQAPAGGVVAFAGTVPGSGASVTILTSDGWSVTITQLGSIAVAKGATVVEGDSIGTIGPSGDPEVGGPYVQFGIRHADQDQGYVDPAGLLPPRAVDAGAATPVSEPAAPVPAPPPPPPPPARPNPAPPLPRPPRRPRRPCQALRPQSPTRPRRPPSRRPRRRPLPRPPLLRPLPQPLLRPQPLPSALQ